MNFVMAWFKSSKTLSAKFVRIEQFDVGFIKQIPTKQFSFGENVNL